ncbi:unnamed protein product [Larinioides sclopetarius]|uniref:CRAL-TRIO domain-containing protein n=2 Tax=Larinioides sclopetarius TaxID=280406 RepID=A0AAV2BMV9_9ARAC
MLLIVFKLPMQNRRKILLQDEKATKEICFHDDFLVQYLRHSKYNTNQAFDRLRKFIIFRKKEEKMFESFSDELFVKPSAKFLTILPKRSPDGCTVVLGQLSKWNPNELPFEDLKKIVLITFLQLFRDPMTQINGIKSIYDFAGTYFEHFKYGTPQNLYFLYHVALCCVPGRYKEFHLLNPNPGLRVLWSIIKRFLYNKIIERVFIHSDAKDILKHFPKSVLPVQYGGELLDMHATNFLQRANIEQKENTVAGQLNFF